MKKYKYLTIKGDEEFVNKRLEAVGVDGWELVSVIYQPRVIYGYSFLVFGQVIAYLKREI